MDSKTFILLLLLSAAGKKCTVKDICL